jgi:hypothetical protein
MPSSRKSNSTFARKSVTLGGNITFTTSNRAPGFIMLLRVTADGALRTITWPAGWKWLGAGAPANIAANKNALLKLYCWGTNDADILARWLVEP